ncbi:MAG TPA: VOC family protein [Dongiaceae bacterium]|jgi:catechol 2,3-dioxygenase-like lactoylglutathione lyase family enzyme
MIGESAIAGIDHTLIGVRDLEAARAAWSRLGLKLTPRGRHIGWGTANYCIMLERGYIELLGIIDPQQFTSGLDKFLEQREGMLGLAFQSQEAAKTAAWLQTQGLHPEGPRDLARALELPEGDLMPAFKLVHLPPEETPGLRAFFCQHLSPEIIRGKGWIIHALRAVSLEAVVAVVDDPAALASAYRRLFGDDAVRLEGGAASVATGEGTLEFVTPAALRAMYPGIDIPKVAAPWCAAMRIGVLILADAADYLDASRVTNIVTPRGIAVPPAEMNGVIVEFVTASGS